MWLDPSDIIVLTRKDPGCDVLIPEIPYFVVGASHFTHGIVDLTVLDKECQLHSATTNTSFIEKLKRK